MDDIGFSEMNEEELVEVAKILSKRLIKEIIQGSELEKECEDDNYCRMAVLEGEVSHFKERAEQLSLEARGWEERCANAEHRLNIVIRESTGLEENIKGLEAQIKDAETLHAADIEVIGNLRLTLEDQRTCLAARDMDVRRLERELREARRTVMDEVSAMIPKAVQAERDACADIARAEALRCAQSAPTNILMEIVNKIKARGERK